MSIFRAALCSHQIIPVSNMIQMGRFQKTASVSAPDLNGFCQLFAGFHIDLTLENSRIPLLIIPVAGKVYLSIVKQKRRIDTSLINEDGFRPVSGKIFRPDIKVLVKCIVVRHHIEASVMITKRRCKYTSGTGNSMKFYLT